MSQSSPLREEKLRVLVEDIDCLVENDGYFNKLAMTKLLEDFLTSHSTELLQKIEGMRKETDWKKLTGLSRIKTANENEFYNQALDEVISIINQYK